MALPIAKPNPSCNVHGDHHSEDERERVQECELQRRLRKPPRDEEPVPERRGANVERMLAAVQAEVLTFCARDTGFLVLDAYPLRFRNCAGLDGRFDRLVECQRGGLMILY
jgi:hypothetical protein